MTMTFLIKLFVQWYFLELTLIDDIFFLYLDACQ